MFDQVFTAGDGNYVVMRMDPRIQLLLLKRLMRFVPALTKSDKLIARVRSGEPVEADDALGMLESLAPILADTPDDDIDFIADACLTAARQRSPDGRWIPVRDAESGVMMNDANKQIVRKLLIVSNVLRATFAPMLTEIAPAVADLTGESAASGEAQPGAMPG